MKERPILFSAPMVQAILRGRKSQTRRIMKPQPSEHLDPLEVKAAWDAGFIGIKCPYGKPGDRLWVREAHRLLPCECEETCRVPGKAWYEADCTGYAGAMCEKLRPSIFMPRWASRITLEVTGIRVERVQDISEEDARAEGVGGNAWADLRPDGELRSGPSIKYRADFHDLWNSINGNWSANPYVWVVEFRRVEVAA